MQGRVKFFIQDKGYGFIYPDGDSKEIFFHVSDVDQSRSRQDDPHFLKSEDIVEFFLDEDRDGKPKAVRIKLKAKALPHMKGYDRIPQEDLDFLLELANNLDDLTDAETEQLDEIAEKVRAARGQNRRGRPNPVTVSSEEKRASA